MACPLDCFHICDGSRHAFADSCESFPMAVPDGAPDEPRLKNDISCAYSTEVRFKAA